MRIGRITSAVTMESMAHIREIFSVALVVSGFGCEFSIMSVMIEKERSRFARCHSFDFDAKIKRFIL